MTGVDKETYEMLAEFRSALRQFVRFSEQRARAEGLTPQQHQALLAIQGFPGRDWASVGELAQRLQIQHHSAVGLIDRLQARGLVRREPSPENRRTVAVRLTGDGLKHLERLSDAHRHQIRNIAPMLRAILQRLED
ncbi:MAG: MarR family transcriptional regulator [Magnetospirillum sp.]|nr:MarR family transcriptional regulator [Magnetospirillum sp.]